MKDFLQGRPLAVATSNRRSEPQAPTHLPPITTPHTHPDSINLSDIALDSHALPESIETQESTGPQVELVPDELGRIGHIVIACSCGEKITLQCNY